jgi:hypothetical protein
LQSVGIALILISIVPAVIFAVMVVRRILRRKTTRSHRQVRAAGHASLETVRAMDLSTAAARRQAYARLNSLVRAHLRDTWGVSAANLTPDEIAPALSARASSVPADLVVSVLAECEKALYSPAEMLPSADACRQTVKYAETVLASKW